MCCFWLLESSSYSSLISSAFWASSSASFSAAQRPFSASLMSESLSFLSSLTWSLIKDILSYYDIISFLSPIYFSCIVLCSLDTLAFSSFMLLIVLFIRSYSSYEIWFLMRSCCSRRWKLSYQPWVTCFSRQLSYGLMFMATSLISSNALENTLTFSSLKS